MSIIRALINYFGLSGDSAMANKILATFENVGTPAITMVSIANNAGRITDVIDNTTIRATRGIVAFQFVSHASVAPTTGNPVKLYLIRQTNAGTTIRGGNNALGDVDAGVATEPSNAFLVGTIAVTNAVGFTYAEVFTIQNPGPKFSFVIWNATGQASNATPPAIILQWLPITDEIQ